MVANETLTCTTAEEISLNGARGLAYAVLYYKPLDYKNFMKKGYDVNSYFAFHMIASGLLGSLEVRNAITITRDNKNAVVRAVRGDNYEAEHIRRLDGCAETRDIRAIKNTVNNVWEDVYTKETFNRVVSTSKQY
jgi:hypothetical protein